MAWAFVLIPLENVCRVRTFNSTTGSLPFALFVQVVIEVTRGGVLRDVSRVLQEQPEFWALALGVQTDKMQVLSVERSANHQTRRVLPTSSATLMGDVSDAKVRSD